MKVGLYARVSTEEQAKEGYSIGAQSKKLQQYAELNEWDSVLYVDDGYSAKDLKRPQMASLLNSIQSQEINTVVVYKLDRLTRSVRDLHELLDLFDKYDCKLISLTESLDTSSASGRFFITMSGAMAQWERETIGERTFFGMKEAIKSGKINGKSAFGYKKIGNNFEIVEEEATIVRAIFEKYNRGLGAELILRDLQNDGLIGNEKLWEPTKVLRILENRSYIGEFVVNFRDGEEYVNRDAFPPIISKELFDSVGEVLKRKKRLHPRAKGTARLFSGVLICENCGGNIFGENPNGLRYKCQNKFKMNGCSCGTFKEEELEREFVRYMAQFMRALNSDDQGSSALPQTANNKIKLTKELDKIKNIKAKNHIAFENDLISLDDYKSRIQELNQRELEISESLNNVTEIPRIYSFKVDNFENLWNTLERVDKRNLILKLISKIVMYKEPKGAKLGKLTISEIEYN